MLKEDPSAAPLESWGAFQAIYLASDLPFEVYLLQVVKNLAGKY